MLGHWDMNTSIQSAKANIALIEYRVETLVETKGIVQ